MTQKPKGYWTEETIIFELNIVIDKLGHFPVNNELIKMSKSGLSFAISEHGGFNYFREKMGYDLIKKSPGYWTDETIISELKLAIEELSHFPSQTELIKIGMSDLVGAISKNSGLNCFREKMGYEPLYKPVGYWTEKTIISELKLAIDEAGHFPTSEELYNMGNGGLVNAISKNGGFNYFREKMGYDTIHKSPGYWTEETIISELKLAIDEAGHFPTSEELNKMGIVGLVDAIATHGGLNYFREKMGHDTIQKSKGYWTDEIIISELKLAIDEAGHFPINDDLRKMGKGDLAAAIDKHGGLNYFREKMGYDTIQKSKGYWTDETIISELKLVIEELGHFPNQKELNKMGKSDLIHAIIRNGGINYFREKMGYDIIKKSPGYWTDETIISELKLAIDELGHFTSLDDLNKMGKSDLAASIEQHGGIVYFMEKCGISPSMQEKVRSKKASYHTKRGYKTEQVVKDIITKWTKIHNKPGPNCNVKLSKGNVLEFVCDLDKKIGIDVTNTKASKSTTYQQIERKWRRKDYCLYLDELWIVVFTDILTSYDYEKLNRKSPDNVKVFSIDGFLSELDYSAENYDKIDRLRECSFHTKDEIINLNRTFDEDY